MSEEVVLYPCPACGEHEMVADYDSPAGFPFWFLHCDHCDLEIKRLDTPRLYEMVINSAEGE